MIDINNSLGVTTAPRLDCLSKQPSFGDLFSGRRFSGRWFSGRLRLYGLGLRVWFVGALIFESGIVKGLNIRITIIIPNR